MLKFIGVILFSVMILLNYLANALPFNGKTTGEISAEYPNMFVPAGITFSIWGVIYLLLAGYCVIQFFPDRMKEIRPNAGWLFALSCILNGLWILAWHYEKLPLSLLIMTGLLITLVLINLLIVNLPTGLVKAAFGVYLGWICIATIANVTALLVSSKWNGLGISDETWALVMITTGVLIVCISIIRLSNPFIGLAVIWAFAGIILRQHTDYRLIAVTALIGLIVVGVFTGMGFFSPHLLYKGS